MCLLTYLFKTSAAAGSGTGDQGEILKLQRTIKVNIFIFFQNKLYFMFEPKS